MKEIQLTQGEVAIVDDEDYEYLSQFNWYLDKRKHTCYAETTGRVGIHGRARMHRMLMRPPAGMLVDHINGNGLDNRRCNLRLCTRRENARNQRLSQRNKSGYKGVVWSKWMKKWQAGYHRNGSWKFIGLFDDPKEAALAYDEKVIEHYGEFAVPNFPKTGVANVK